MLIHLLTSLLLLIPGFGGVPVGLPIELTVIEVTSTSATIRWSCFSLTASDIDECVISYGLQNDTVYIQSSYLPESYSLFLANLSAESTYQLSVVCYSAGLLHKSDVLIFSTTAKSQRTSKPSSALIIDGSDFLVKTSTPGLATASNASSNVSASDIDSIIGIVFGLIAAIIVLTCSFLTLRSLQYVRMQRLLQYGAQGSEPSVVPVSQSIN